MKIRTLIAILFMFTLTYPVFARLTEDVQLHPYNRGWSGTLPTAARHVPVSIGESEIQFHLYFDNPPHPQYIDIEIPKRLSVRSTKFHKCRDGFRGEVDLIRWSGGDTRTHRAYYIDFASAEKLTPWVGGCYTGTYLHIRMRLSGGLRTGDIVRIKEYEGGRYTATFSVGTTARQKPVVYRYDVNSDERYDVHDVSAYRGELDRYFADLDYNNDGDLNEDDIVILRREILKRVKAELAAAAPRKPTPQARKVATVWGHLKTAR